MLADVLTVLGGLSVVAGLALFSIPAALMVAGVLLILAGRTLA